MFRIKVPLKQIRAGDADDANFVDGGIAQITTVSIELHRQYALPRQPDADRTGVIASCRRIKGGDATAFGEAVSLEDLYPGFALEAVEQLDRASAPRRRCRIELPSDLDRRGETCKSDEYTVGTPENVLIL